MKMMYFLLNKIRKITKGFSRKKSFREYADIEKVVILFDLEHAEEVKDLSKSLKFADKEVFCYTFNPNTKVELPVFPDCFTVIKKKDLSFTGLPHQNVMDTYKSIQPDTLIDLTVQPHPILQYLSLKSEASYRVGFLKEEKAIDDLLLEYDPEQSFVFLTSQLHFYMKSIRSK